MAGWKYPDVGCFIMLKLIAGWAKEDFQFQAEFLPQDFSLSFQDFSCHSFRAGNDKGGFFPGGGGGRFYLGLPTPC